MLGRVKQFLKAMPLVGSTLRWINHKRVDWLHRRRDRNHYAPWRKRRLQARASQYPAPTERPPTFDILTITYETDPVILKKTAASVLAQDYAHWRWVILDNGSRRPETQAVLSELERDPRVIVHRHPQNLGITAGHRAGLDLCSAEYIVLLDHDDLLTSDALRIVAWHIDQNDRPVYLYSDEDKCGLDDKHFYPAIKPDVSPTLILETMYCCHLSVARLDALRKCEAFTNPEVEGTQDWDMAVRLFESGGRICHIPELLYTWRSSATSTAVLGISAKPYVLQAQRRCLETALRRRKLADRFVVQSNPLFPLPDGHWHLKRQPTAIAPLVDLLLPAEESAEDLAQTIASILRQTDYPHYRLRVIGTLQAASLTRLPERIAELCGDLPPHVRFEPGPAGSLNLSKLFNRACEDWQITPIDDEPESLPLGAATHSREQADRPDGICWRERAEFCGMIPPGTRLTNRHWLWEAIGLFELSPQAGLVGGRTYQAGDLLVGGPGICGLKGMVAVAYEGQSRFEPGSQGFNFCRREVACILHAPWIARRTAIQAIGGMDERYAREFFEADLGIRLNEAGYSVVYTPFIVSATVQDSNRDEHVHAEISLLYEQHFEWLRNDPFYGAIFSLDHRRMYEIVEPAERAGYLNARLSHLHASRGDTVEIPPVPETHYETPHSRMKRTAA